MRTIVTLSVRLVIYSLTSFRLPTAANLRTAKAAPELLKNKLPVVPLVSRLAEK